MRIFTRDLFPWLGAIPIKQLKSPALVSVLDRVRGRGALETAHRVKNLVGMVLRYAVPTERAERDWTPDLKGYLPPTQERHFAAITDPVELAPLLRDMDAYEGSFVVKCALRLAPLFFVRPGELRKAEWRECDFNEKLWTIPGPRMKGPKIKDKPDHIVPLCSQAIEILTELKNLTGRSPYVFPSARSFTKPMSDAALVAALRYMGYDKGIATVHGFRATARTILDEVLEQRVDIIEHQLAHQVIDANGRAYNRTAFLPQRRVMMQLWADYLDRIKKEL